jgi:TolB-like protein
MQEELSMDQFFFNKLIDILEVNYSTEQFGAMELSQKIGISRSQLHRKLNILIQKSTSQFIREFRLKKAMEMLQSNVATASEIAYRVGFNSPSYFNTCFHNFFGYPPGEVKFKKTFIKENELTLKKQRISASNNSKSIAVLPFKNLSNKDENQYFADGIMEVILNNLTNVKELKVISRTSIEQYRNTTKTSPQIAKDLGVSHILEASVQKYNNEIRVIAQLIDAKNDQHLWATDIKKEFVDIFDLQSDIAKQIATELNANLTASEIDLIDKRPTQNLEAYNLYLKGLHFNNLNECTKSINCLELVIEKDPQFALAYSALTQVYLRQMYFGDVAVHNVILKVKKLIRKTIVNDSSLAEPHAWLGSIYHLYEWNWASSEEEFLSAIKLNPKDSWTRILYSKLLHATGRIIESRKQINYAQSIDPVSFSCYFHSAEFYFHLGEYEKALAENKKALYLHKNNSWAHRLNFDIYMAQNNYDIAISELQHVMEISSSTKKYVAKIGEIYAQYDIESVFNWLIELELVESKNSHNKPFLMAYKYAFVGNHEMALTMLEKSAELKISKMTMINRYPYFKNLRSEPRFKKLLKKMGLENFPYFD